MDSFKILLIFYALFFGTFGQRFQRHLPNDNQNESALDMVRMTEMTLDQLSSDNGIVTLEKSGNSIKLVLLNGRELKFEFCSQNCMDKEVSVCYEAAIGKYNDDAKGQCSGLNQCEFRAGVEEKHGAKQFWFVKAGEYVEPYYDAQACATSVMQYPLANIFNYRIKSCQPLIKNGIVELYVQTASKECPLKVIGAKEWFPTTPSGTTQALSGIDPNNDASISDETMWIIIGIGIVAVIIVLACSGFWGYRYWKQRKSVSKIDEKKKETVPDKKVTQTIVAKEEKMIEEKGKTTKDETEEKKENVPAKPKKTGNEVQKDGDHQVVAKTPKKKTIEPTQEETPSGKTVEPTVEDSTHPSIIQNCAPTVSILKDPIHPPRPYGLAPRSAKSYSKSHKTDSLSGRHDLNIKNMVETPLQTLERCKPSVINDEMKKFYPTDGKAHGLDGREIAILCCRISAMFRIIEELIGAAEEKLKKRGVKFDGNGFITEVPQKGHDYLMSENCHEYVRSFAFGNLFREQIDSALGSETTSSIPLLFVIILQRRYPVENRRKACAWIRRQLPILRIEFSIHERVKLPYPLNAIETACERDVKGFTNTTDLCTLSKDEKSSDAEKKEKIGMKKSKVKK